MDKPRISIVVAVTSKNAAIGNGGKLLHHISDDLKRFKAITKGHPVIMGRKTFESIFVMLGKPLPNRTNIVVTRDTAWHYPEVTAAHSLEDALEKARVINSDVYIIGGAQIYEQALPYADTLHLTLIDAKKDADIFFPPYEQMFTKKIFEEKRELDGLSYTWVDLEKEKTTDLR